LVLSMRDELEEVDVEGHRAWLFREDLAALRRARPTTDVRLLPNFDVYVVGSHPRASVTPEASAELVFRKGAWVSPVVTVGGRAVAVWEQRDRRGRTELSVTPFASLSRDVQHGVREEAERLAAFVGRPVDVSFSV
ncbi:MAG: winged helix DNA-binding domain-containing protein, partial [Actinomycetota bacterium]|nr:winged helix DNA-binding domain-containing protein [Actinomycetota bacterium]